MQNASLNWRAVFESVNPESVIYAQIKFTTGAITEGTNLFTFCSGGAPYTVAGGAPPASLTGLPGIAVELNPASRTITVGGATVEFMDDRTLRDLLAVPQYLKNKMLVLSVGARTMQLADFLPLGTFVIADLKTTPGAIFLTLKDLRSLPAGAKLSPSPSTNFPCQHPLENIQTFLSAAGTTNFDTSLNPSSWGPNNIGHFNTSRFATAYVADPVTNPLICASFDGGVTSDMDLRQAVADMERLLGGALICDELGLWRFRRFDPTAAIADPVTWDANEIKSCDMMETWNEHYNQMNFTYAGGVASSPLAWVAASQPAFKNTPSFTIWDDASANRYIVAGVDSTARFAAPPVTTSWLNGVAQMTTNTGGTGAVTFQVSHAAQFGFCGARYTGLLGPPAVVADFVNARPSWAAPSATQPVWLRITGTFGAARPQEIVRVESITYTDVALNADRDHLGHYRPTYLNFVVTAPHRALMGSSAFDWLQIINNSPSSSPVVVEDITIPVYLYQSLIPRAKDGIAKARVVTSTRKQPVQLGDFVSVSDPRIVVLGYQAGDPSLKWEVVRKCSYLIDRNPRIEWILALASNPRAAAASTDLALTNNWFGYGI